MKITVVVACRNEASTLGACLDALTEQDHSDHDVIIVDGGSIDGSHELARSRGFHVLADEGRGPAAARNIGLAAASSPIVAFTDADCVPRFDWLSHLAARFEADPTVAAVAGALRMPRASLLGRLEDNDARLCYHGYITSNIAYRRAILHELGGFDERLACAEDYDLAWRALDAGHRILQEPRAIVLHTPPEAQGSVARYLRKQFWYARCDVPAHLRAARRAWAAPGDAAGARAAVASFAGALGHAAIAGGALVGVARGSPTLLAMSLGSATILSARRVARNVKAIGEGGEELAKMAAVEVAKRLVRGAGTMVGIAQLASPARASFRLRARRARAPELPPARPRAVS